MIQRLTAIAALLCFMLLLGGCPKPAATDAGTGLPAAQTAGAGDVEGQAAESQPAGESTDNALTAAGTTDSGAPKQLVLIYSGNIHGRLLPAGSVAMDNLTGGLSALTAEVTAVEQEILNYNRMRVANSGGDASTVRVELDSGMIGDNPFMLLDYGGWYNPDLLEHPEQAALVLEAFSAMQYSAVAMRDWQLLSPDELKLVGGMQPRPLFLNTPGSQPGDISELSRVLVREAQDTDWAVLSLPRLPETERELYDRNILALLDDCAAELAISGAKYSILLAADQTGTVYKALQKDKRFTVVIGAPGTMSPGDGFGELPVDGPLMLPHLTDGGTQLARCHLIWTDESEGPVNFFFERREVKDNGSPDLPWRRRISELSEPAQ
ncbi:hypothetical protein KDL29_14595 [bacterium]|nr:hypothetical protein [bacterium]